MNFYAASALTALVFTIAISLIVWWKASDKSLGRFFAIVNVAVSLWVLGCFGESYASGRWAHLFDVLLYTGASLAPALFLHFAISFSNQMRRFRHFLCLNYAVSIIFALINVIPASRPLFIVAVSHRYAYRYIAEPGPLWYVFSFWYLIPISTILAILFRGYQTTPPGNKKEQFLYFFLAAALLVAGGALYFGLVYSVRVPFIDNFFTIGYGALMAYAILRHRLMDITIIIRKTMFYSIISAGLASIYAGGVTLLARLLESPSAAGVLLPSEIFKWLGSVLKGSFTFFCIATSVLSTGLGIFVLLKGSRKAVNLLWCATCISISAWCLATGMMSRSSSMSEALRWSSVLFLGSITIPIVFAHFAIVLSKMKTPLIIYFGYGIAFILQFVNVSGYLASVKIYPPFNYNVLPMKSYPLFAGYFFLFVLYGHWILYRGMRYAEGNLKNQIKFIFLGTAIGFCGGSTTFFMDFGIDAFPYGMYAVPIYILTVSYAIFKHRLMDINVAIRKALLYSLVSAALTAIYVGTITLLAQMLGGPHRPAAAFSSALAAIFITLLFNPLRIRTQRWIDRHFPRERLDPDLLQEAAGGFAHEMKRPLSKISLPAELTLLDLEQVKSGEKSWKDFLPTLEKRLQYIIRQSIDAGHTIEAIRELSSASTEPFESVNVRQVFDEALRAQNDLLEKHNVVVHVDPIANSSFVLGRVKQLEIVFINLIKNAVEAMSELPAGRPREILISARKKENNIVIHLRDAGPGLRTGDLEKIFQPHYTTKGPLGTGMGLYLSHQIILAHKGTIELSMQAGKGAEFIVHLPCRKGKQ